MTAYEFIPYHNYHIIFGLSNGIANSGVLFANFSNPLRHKPHTLYTFIPTRNMIEWRDAERDKDEFKMKILQSEIDISDIVWAKRV